ncbi:MAG TPA: S8 family serine peptidase [Thermoanaerobaculia bacterium]|nr:S8 family serine peptidase [Thermoanaerobaculia bacterium]
MKRTLLIPLLLLLCLTAKSEAPKKIVIEKADELPRRSFKLEGTALQLLDDQKQLDKLAAELTRNLEADLAKYDIRDAATLKGYYSILHLLHMRAGQYDKALALLPKMREAESKPGLQHMTGLFSQAYVDALRKVNDPAAPAFKSAFEAAYAAQLAKLPWSEVQEHVEEQKGQLAMMTAEMMLGGVQSGFQQLIDNTKGVVPEGAVAGLLTTKYLLTHRIPLRDESIRALGKLRDANHKEDTAADIWQERSVSLDEASNLKPVVVGVWDSGVDANALPATNRFVNAKETFDGKDNDGNGYVDDVHGIGYDLAAGKKSPGTLDNPAGKIKSDVKRLQRLTKGAIDLQASIQSEEAAELQKTIASLQRDQVQEFSEELGFYTNYFHGTHVAGIVADGNPAAKILGARMTAPSTLIPPVPTMELTRFTAQMYRDTVDYFKKHGVRVVNMSWRYSAASIEGALTANGVGGSEADRKALARKMFDIEKAALRDAIKGAPGILFVCGSGNENNSADFSEYIPASLNLPNLVTVGAVDHAGRKTSFTTEGASIDFYANGFEIESYVPGGDRIRMSGTSMSSPQVANLAAKLLALDPSLTPAQLIALIGKGADEKKLIHPARTLLLARK